PGTTTLWFPQNVTKVDAYGIETAITLSEQVGKSHFEFTGSYAYTVSENSKTGYQLIYVPFHKGTAAVAFSRGRVSATWQAVFNGEVFTRSDNSPNHTIDAYSVSNLSMAYKFGNDTLAIGFKI